MTEVETKEFPTAAVATVATGFVLCEMSKAHECAEWMLGCPIWLHQFPSLRETFEKIVTEQFPGMPLNLENCTPDNYQEHLATIEEKFGKTLLVKKGSGITLKPTDYLPEKTKSFIVSWN